VAKSRRVKALRQLSVKGEGSGKLKDALISSA
jgi:hypothetical protein